MSGVTSHCTRNLKLSEFPVTSIRVFPSFQRQRNLSPQHVTLTQASRPSTTSASGAFAGGGNNVLKEKHRVVVMGAAFVGKTQIIQQFLYDKFTNRYRETIEQLHRGEYELPDGSSLTLDILDTSGAFSFPAMRELSIRTSNAFILVFSIDNEDSWNEVECLRKKIIQLRGPRVPIVVVCNKMDLSYEQRQMTKEVVESIVKLDWECGFVECSAKNNENIVNVFKELLVQAKIRYNLSPAVRRRRQSLPSFANSSSSPKFSLKRHSCSVS
ncbi:CLUMA_CG009631, isoform A [Clunio marinus]|uniref:CLUMA_CG009631, isoform A n=1 Tax=Clunio marinus TaxID=568069 RepID=A0A1J1I7P0_9DIPT|nr:CLUMA_CG009631, isoform A [Clunio marinus]